MLFISLLAPALFFTSTLAIDLKVNPKIPVPNSNVNITWHTVTPAPPAEFALILHYPNTSETSRNVTRNGRTSGFEEMAVGQEGAYLVQAIVIPGVPVGQFAFNVQGDAGSHSPTSTPAATATATSETTTLKNTSSPSNSPSNSPTGSPTSSATFNSTSGHPTSTTTNSSPTSITTSPSPSQASSPPTSPTVSHPTQSTTETTEPPILPSTSSLVLSPSSSPKRGTIIGSVLGSVAFLTILAAILFLLRRRQKQRKDMPVTFYKDMMVRSPGPTLYALSNGASSAGRDMSPTLRETDLYLMTPLNGTTSDPPSVESGQEDQYALPTHTRKKSNPFRDPEVMSRYSRHFDDTSAVSPSPLPEGLPGLIPDRSDVPRQTLL